MILLSPFLYAILVPLFDKYVGRVNTGWFALPLPLALFVFLLGYIRVLAENPASIQSIAWIPSLGINYAVYADGLALLFGLIITGIGVLVIVYSIYYLAKDREALGNFYTYLLLFMGAMLGVVFSDNVLVLYMFWELTSIASFLLIGFWYQRKASRYGAQKSLLITMLGGFAMLAGFLLLANLAGTFSIRAMIGQVGAMSADPTFVPAMVLVLLGAFTKSAQFPFHIWLPDAMEAPTPISAYLHSATMVKAGIYLIARFTPIFGGLSEWFWLVSGVGMVTLFWGSWSALRQVDLKAMLAFSTISQLGMITCLLGIGSAAMYYGPGPAGALYTTAILAAVFHLLNHSTFKGCLFMIVGIVDHTTGTRDVRKLGGLMNLMPLTFTMAVIASASMAGLPPFNGFLSKELFFTGVLNASRLDIFQMETWGQLFPILAWIASTFTFVYCLIFVTKTFLGKYRPQKLEKKPREVSWGMILPPLLLAVLVVLFFFFPNEVAGFLLLPAIASILPGFIDSGPGVVVISAWHGWTPELLMTLGVVIAGSILFAVVRGRSDLYRRLPEQFSLNFLYDRFLVRSTEISFSSINAYMTGVLRHYLLYILAFLVLVLGVGMWRLQCFAFTPGGDSPVSLYEIILALVLIVAGLVVLCSRNRLSAIIGMGVMGYIVVMFFVIFRAPDLALTQLVVETFTVVLFLLCFHFLPKMAGHMEPLAFRAGNLIVSLAVGALVTVAVLTAQSSRSFAPISQFYTEKAYELAGGKNIVNTILVDFRGFDTMLEILVLCMAGLGVYTLISIRCAMGDDDENP